jgi:tRNA threonylcarbamoyladenosine biosynthesis protein TsaB
MITLAIDASTYVGTIAVIRGGDILASSDAAMRGEREERLMPAVAATLEAAGVAPMDLGCVVCGAGPGSFTSLRIAAAIAKGLAMAHGLPLRAVSSLLLMVAGLDPLPGGGRYLALLDALRGETYAQLVQVGTAAGEVEAVGEPLLVANEQVSAMARELGAVTVGVGRAISAAPHARGAVHLAANVIASGVVHLESWEPEYGRLAEAQVRWEAAHGRPLAKG